ncbi:response regulator transcription factor [Aliiroseovarius crassostreae]|uniref:Response regulator transcription factor n=1 Tax=Aliiroseovarius crassostreae TaxID=154981 RepID=A0A9Q9LSY8_9RHOB|nr:response regulator transcription factor [Aliiroseovarius crassostreae]UWP88302.1 response regulator transcription factor [Aliiroseovarius crassostreae]UWP91460.1 response regulator transcription factor [Aliiroseovarius crassostreae]UWP94635.1 response regulator transcription factor [Aliiroseovarius crassostreae]UWP97779.1 response regulator transcription factor [Aliiroseovarius crassostreae]UWQ00961.1 response regulator transcription factor [Aliiroseovarius crassostreae]
MTLRILVADDHPIFRDGLVTSLEETGEFQVVALASTADEAVELARQHQPDLALVDLSMPGGGMQAIARISADNLSGRIVMLTVSEEGEHVTEALQLGANGYVLKGVSARELRQILKQVAAGETHVSPALAQKVLSLMSQGQGRPEPSPLRDLSAREEEILRLVARGQSNREVAEALGLQEKTVKHYMTAIMEKLHARNRVEAAIIAHEAWRS